METTDEDLDALLGAAAETLPEAEEFVDVGLLQAFRADHLDADSIDLPSGRGRAPIQPGHSPPPLLVK